MIPHIKFENYLNNLLVMCKNMDNSLQYIFYHYHIKIVIKKIKYMIY
jgi:hypothetical protein